MRATEFLAEEFTDQNIENIKSVIGHKIQDLPADDETVKTLSEIEDLLNHSKSGGKIGYVNNKLSDLDDASVTAARKLLAKYILAIPMTPAQRENLFKRWKADKLVNHKALLTRGKKNTFTDIIVGYGKDPIITELTDDLIEIQAYGQGKGEFLLSVFSRKITKREGGGDLSVAGVNVEVKTSKGGSGRFYDHNVRPTNDYSNVAQNIINTYKKEMKLNQIVPSKTGINLTQIMQIYQILEGSKKAQFIKQFKNLLSTIFPEANIADIVRNIQTGNLDGARLQYGKASFENYIAQKDDQGVLLIDISGKAGWTLFYSNYADLQNGGFTFKVDTAYPISSNVMNCYPQVAVA